MGLKIMVKNKNSIGNLALSVFKFELMGKFFAATITITVLGIASAIHKSGFFLNQILVCLVYFPSFYGVLWKTGNRAPDPSIDRWKGLKVGFLASVPYFLGTVVLIILKILQSEVSVFWYRILNIQYLSILNTIFSEGNNITQTTWPSIFICIVLQFIIPLVSQLSYTIGCHHFSISEHIMYKNISNQRK